MRLHSASRACASCLQSGAPSDELEQVGVEGVVVLGGEAGGGVRDLARIVADGERADAVVHLGRRVTWGGSMWGGVTWGWGHA
eukprot:4595399-Prymnesium_polylepis.1